MKVRFDQYILQNFIHTCHCTKNESYFCTVWGQGINQNHRLSKLQGKTVKIFSFEDFSAPLFYNLQIVKAMDLISEAATGGILLKMVVLRISQISQENSCVGVLF